MRTYPAQKKKELSADVPHLLLNANMGIGHQLVERQGSAWREGWPCRIRRSGKPATRRLASKECNPAMGKVLRDCTPAGSFSLSVALIPRGRAPLIDPNRIPLRTPRNPTQSSLQCKAELRDPNHFFQDERDTNEKSRGQSR